MIELKNVCKTYKGQGYNVDALKNINISFNDKGLVSIVGASGCGKTTLLNLIGGLDSDYEGDILFNSSSIKEYKSKKLDIYRGEKIGFVFQEYNLINTIDVYSNIEIALSLNKISKKDKKNNIIKISKELGIEDLLYKKPLELSGGQKQRVAIARALVKNPKVILADEPTGALDSTTSNEIMKIIKEISNRCLVIMVTHNDKIANEYSDRIINMSDGMIIEDKIINNINNLDIKTEENNKNRYPISQLLKLSFNNLRTKLIRTLLIIFACSIGIVALCVVLTVSNGMGLYIEEVQEQALRTYPITINSTVDNEEPEIENKEYEEYPNSDIIHIVDNELTYNGHINTFTNEFMTHIRTMDESLYSAMTYSGWVKMRLLAKNGDKYNYVTSNYYLKELNYDYQYVNYEYDILAGSLPKNKEDLVLVIDKNNCINRSVLESLGMDVSDITNMKFEDMIGKSYKVITPDLYYQNVDGVYYPLSSSTLSSYVYEHSALEVTIKGIIRQKQSAKSKLYGTSILYSPLLTDYLLEYNNKCPIVIDQKENPDINVLTGKEFEEYKTDYYHYTKEYQYEANLSNFGSTYQVTRILIYTDRFENFELIHNYIEEYNNDEATVSQIRYTDYLKNMTDEFTTFMNVLTTVLLVFSAISLTVASIMIVIITYVSVIEQTKQVGILRSLGMNKINVMSLFVSENALIGLCSGVIGVILGTLLIEPVLNLIINVIRDINLNSFSVESLEMSRFNIIHLILLILGSILLTVVSGIIPSILASRKDPVKALMHQ